MQTNPAVEQNKSRIKVYIRYETSFHFKLFSHKQLTTNTLFTSNNTNNQRQNIDNTAPGDVHFLVNNRTPPQFSQRVAS